MNVPSVGDSAGRTLALPGHLLLRSRPRFWLYLGGTALVGVVWGANTQSILLDPLTIGLIAYFLVPANLFLYGINDRFDRETDAVNPRKGAEGPEVRASHDRRVTLAVLIAGAAGLGFLPVLPPVSGLAVLGFLILAVLYSAPPARLKARPVVDSVSNGLYLLPGVAGYALVAGRAPPIAVLVVGWLWTMAMHAFSAIPDIEPDRAAGVRTTATRLGQRRTLFAVTGLWALAAMIGTVHHPGFGALFAVYPLLSGAVASVNISVERAYRWFPWLNGFVGMLLTLVGLWRLTGGV